MQAQWIHALLHNFIIVTCTYSTPCADCRAMSINWYISNRVSMTCRCLYRVEPSHHCVTMVIWGSAVQPINRRMFAWRVFLEGIITFVGTDSKWISTCTCKLHSPEIRINRIWPTTGTCKNIIMVMIYTYMYCHPSTTDLCIIYSILHFPYLSTPTSFLNACSCFSVGLVTLSFFTATGPCIKYSNQVKVIGIFKQ